MLRVLTVNKVTNVEEYLTLAKEFVKDILTEKGCLDMEICRGSEKNAVYFISKWEGKSFFEEHLEGEVFNKHIPLLEKYFISCTETLLEVETL